MPRTSRWRRLERDGWVSAVVTQNIDLLHERAGSQTVVEVHGSIRTSSCLSCYTRVPLADVIRLLDGAVAPGCPTCGSVLKPDVVMFGEILPRVAMDRAYELARGAALMLVVGSSLEVWPVAGLPLEAAAFAVVNRGPTALDGQAVLKIDAAAGETLAAVAELLDTLMEMRAAILVVVLALAAAACGAGEQPAKPVAAPPPPPAPPAASEPVLGPTVPPPHEEQGCKGDIAGLGGERFAYAAVAERKTVAYEEPGGKRISSFGALNVNGHVTVFGVRRVVLVPTARSSGIASGCPSGRTASKAMSTPTTSGSCVFPRVSPSISRSESWSSSATGSRCSARPLPSARRAPRRPPAATT